MRYSLVIMAVCVVVFAVQTLIPSFTGDFLLNEDSWQQPWRFVTSIFLHGDIGHLLYNMLALFFFGLALEHFIGGKRFLLVYFLSGILANITSIFFYPASLGASGAIFGIIGALVIIRPGMQAFAFGFPMPMFLAGILYAFIDIAGLFNPTSTTGHIAHLSGIVFGAIFGLIFRNRAMRFNIVRQREEINDRDFYAWEERWMR